MRRLRGLAATALGVVAGGWLAAGPVVAHEGSTPTTVAVVTVGTSAGAVPAGEELPGVAEYGVPTPAMAGERGGDGWFDFAALVAAAGVVAVAATAGALAFSRRRGARLSWPGRLQVGGAVALLFTGVAHCASAPAHFAEGWHLGAFFVGSGLLLLGQAALVCVRPSQAAYRSVVASTVALVALYVLGRQLTLPLVDHRDPYLLEDLPVKMAELAAAGLAIAGQHAFRRRRQPVSSETFGSAGAMSVSARPVPLPTGFSPSM
jgi:hypothetical protein